MKERIDRAKLPGTRPSATGLEQRRLLPSYEVRRELEAIKEADPAVARLILRDPSEPELPDYQLLLGGQSPFYIVRVPVSQRPGMVWVSRLPGIRPTFTEDEVSALRAFGIVRVVCLVPSAALEELHGAYRYLSAVRAKFPNTFHQVEIVDHEVPGDDEEFERVVEAIDEALRSGEQVLVHCVGGCGRTGMFVACLMVRAGAEAKTAIRSFRRSRRCGPETADQAAYVVRFAKRFGSRETRPTTVSEAPVRIRFSVTADGQRRLIARGGLSSIYAGRLSLPDGGTRRVAIKMFHSPLDEESLRTMPLCIAALARAGVRLPRMAMLKLPNESVWVQVTPLFGSLRRGSKLEQPAQFYKKLDDEQKAFAIDQLTRVVNAGYSPSLDLFVVFKDETKGIMPLDLDLIVPEKDVLGASRKLLAAIIHVGDTPQQRDGLLSVAKATARADVEEALSDIMRSEDVFQRYWTLD